MPELLPDLLERAADRHPDRRALHCEGEDLTYAAFEAETNRLAHLLRANGVRRGDRVAVWLPSGLAAAIAVFAVVKADAVVVVLDRSTRPPLLAHVLADAGVRALVTTPRAEQPPVPFVLAVDGLAELRAACASFPATPPPRRAIDRDLACLVYTSGSTGRSRGVMSDHSNVLFATSAIDAYLDHRPDDVVLSALPLSFDYGLYQLFLTVRAGAALVLEPSFAFPAMVLDSLVEQRVTGLPGVPTTFALLLRQDLSRWDLSALRYVTNTGAALAPAHLAALRAALPAVRVFSMYGLTETKRTLYLPPEELDRRPGSVGLPIPGTEVWVEDEAGHRLPPGQTGELVVRGRHVMRGYWNDPEATAARFRPGPLPGETVCHTGDLFRSDEDGYWTFVARKDDVLKSRGEKVAPREVEDVLHAHPGVAEAAVVGVADELLGHRVVALVVRADPGLSEREVLAWCRARLEDFKIPQTVSFREALPHLPSGKVDRAALR